MLAALRERIGISRKLIALKIALSGHKSKADIGVDLIYRLRDNRKQIAYRIALIIEPLFSKHGIVLG